MNIEVSLFDASLNLLQTESPASTLGAVLTRALSAGTYFIRIDGVGSGDPLTDGYSDYGSLGEFSIDVSVAAPAASLLAAPESLAVQAQNGNAGTSAMGAFVSFYVSPTAAPGVETSLLRRIGGTEAAGSPDAVSSVYAAPVPVIDPITIFALRSAKSTAVRDSAIDELMQQLADEAFDLL